MRCQKGFNSSSSSSKKKRRSKIISFLLDNAKLYTINFASNSTLDNQHHLLPESPHLPEHKLCDIYYNLGGLQAYQKPCL